MLTTGMMLQENVIKLGSGVVYARIQEFSSEGGGGVQVNLTKKS